MPSRLVPASLLVLTLAAAGLRAEPAPDLREALERASQSSDPLRAITERAEVFHRARDFAAVLREVERGLDLDAAHLELLWRGASAELWLQDGAASLSYTERLERALDQADLPDATVAEWRAAAAGLREEGQRLTEVAREGERALGRARAIVVAAATASLALGLWSLRRRPTPESGRPR